MDDINNHTSGIERVVDLLIESRCLLLITGAGISADSGLPTYRGIGGLYNVNDTEEGMPIEMLLSGPTMSTAPELTWKYLAQIANACCGANTGSPPPVRGPFPRGPVTLPPPPCRKRTRGTR